MKNEEQIMTITSTNIKSFNMESGEIRTVKENACVYTIHGDKLIYKNDELKELFCCNFDSSEEESLNDWIDCELNIDQMSISVRSDGEYIWEVLDPNPDSESNMSGSSKYILMKQKALHQSNIWR